MTTTLTNQSRNSATLTNQSFGLTAPTLSVAGMYYGFGAFTYSGGQQLAPGHLPVMANQGRNSATLTNQSRN